MGLFRKKPTLEDQVFEMAFTSKQMARLSSKCEQEEKEMRKKVKDAIVKGNNEGAAIYAQNAIRKKNESLNYLRLSSRLDAVASQLKSAIQMDAVSSNMKRITSSLDVALSSMDMEEISRIVDKFENQFEDLDVRSKFMEGAMSTTTASTAPQEDVDSLIGEVAAEAGLEWSAELGHIPSQGVKATAKIQDKDPEIDDLEARFAALNK